MISLPDPTSPEFEKKARFGLIILTLVNVLNYLDRYVVSALVESLKASELKLTDTQAGFLMTSFLIVYMLVSPIFGSLGDRGSRVKLMAFGVLLWSVATLAGSIAWSFAALFFFRALIGVGEAAYGTIAPALISDYFRPAIRGRIFSIFYCAIPVGSAIGYVVGGLMDKHFGWRSAFLVAGAPGIILAFLILKLMDPPRGIFDPKDVVLDEGSQVRDSGFDLWKKTLGTYLELLKLRTFRWIVIGFGGYTFALGALAFWIPAFLEREKGMSREAASFNFGLVVVVTGFVGTFLGGYIADFLLRKYKEANLWLSGITLVLSAPFMAFCFLSEVGIGFWVAMVIAQILVFMSTGPLNLAVINSVPVNMRATAVALSILGCHLLGDVPSPPFIGWVSDQSNLRSAMMIIPIVALAGGLIWCWEAYRSSKEAK